MAECPGRINPEPPGPLRIESVGLRVVNRDPFRGERRCCDDRQRRSAGSQDPELSGFSDLRCRGCRSRHGNDSPLPDYGQAMRWARLERKSYKIPEPDIEVAA